MQIRAAIACLLAPALALAVGLKVPPGLTGAPRMVLDGDARDAVDRLPLKDHRVDVEIAGVIAQVHVTQVYENLGRTPLNATYLFPAGTRAAVSAMKMTVGNRTTRAVIQERAEAEKTFKRAQAEGKTASLLEQQRPNVLSMRVANILPGDMVTVDLEYSELVTPTDGTYELVLPAVVGPRYASDHDDVPTAGAPPYARQATHHYDAAVRIVSGIPVADVQSATHRVGVLAANDGSVQVVLDASDPEPGNRDFVLRYRLADRAIQAGVLVHEAETSTVLAMVEPPQRPADADITRREYIFLVDVSGSMGGTPLETAKSLLRRLTRSLHPSDRFNVVLFESAPFVMAGRSVRATPENIRAAEVAMDGFNGGGGTEMLAGMRAALELPRTPGMSRTVLLVTDGFVNVEQQAFELVRSHLHDMNLFAFGIGSSVNRHLIEGLARAGRGEPFVVEGDAGTEGAAKRFWDYVRAPVLMDVRVRFEGIEVTDVLPSAVPDLFASRPLAVMAHFKGEPRGEIVVTGRSAAGAVELRLPLRSTVRGNNPALPLLWARHRLAELSDGADTSTQEHNRPAITALALQYGLLSAFTSFVAVDDRVRNTNGSVDVDQPLPLPSGVPEAAVANKIAGLFGTGSGSAFGYGGLGVAGIGRLGMRGSGGGNAGYGGGGLGGKTAHAIDISQGALMPIIQGSLDKDVIRRVIRNHMAQVRYCYERELVRTPGLGGRLSVKFVIGANGSVQSAVIAESDLNSAAVEGCVTSKVRSWVFPKAKGGGSVIVTYPFVFRTAEPR